VHDLKTFWAVLTGVILALVASQITEEFTSTERGPVKEIAESARTGPATTVLAGFSIGLESSVWAIIAIAIAIGVAVGLGGGTSSSPSTWWPSSASAAGHHRDGRLRGQFRPGLGQRGRRGRDVRRVHREAERIMVSLDAVGNTTKAITKGVAIGSAVIAAVALFASFIETVGAQLHLSTVGLFHNPLTQINVSNPVTFIGLLIGGSVAFLFSSLAIRAVGRSAGTVVQEVRRQFREHPGIMDYLEKPEYGRVISICTAASQRELATRRCWPSSRRSSSASASTTSPSVRFGRGHPHRPVMANTLSNSGGAWDNAKKYIEDGNEGGKDPSHKAAVIGDTVGARSRDTAGPALNR